MAVHSEEAQREKNNAALTSVVAAVGLTSLKIVVGLLTNSLGILAEAAHSALDLVAALVTLFAVRFSSKPADQEHTYGHGKIENLSALFETLLLLATCVWIIYEAFQRLFVNPGTEVDPSIWAFIVMGISILVDAGRSRVLSRTAKKYNSQALEADALHFSTDIWSSSVVIFGLLCVLLSSLVPGLAFLKHADAVAALGVACIVIYVSVKLGIRTIYGLLDTAPKGLAEKIQATLETVPGVENCHHVRLRGSGAHLFVDVHVLVNGDLPTRETHALTELLEQKIDELSPGADVTIHVEPKD